MIAYEKKNQVLLKNIFFVARKAVQKCALGTFCVSSSVTNNRRREIFEKNTSSSREEKSREREYLFGLTCYHRTTLAPTLCHPHVIVVIVILLLRLRMISDLRGRLRMEKGFITLIILYYNNFIRDIREIITDYFRGYYSP